MSGFRFLDKHPPQEAPPREPESPWTGVIKWGGLAASTLVAAGLVFNYLTQTPDEDKKNRRLLQKLVAKHFRSHKSDIIRLISGNEWCQLTEDEIRKIHFHFGKLIPEDSECGRVDRAQVVEVYHKVGMNDDLLEESLYRLWDRNVDGHIDFVELCYGINTMVHGSTVAKLRMYFNAYDINRNGFIDREEFAHVLRAFYAGLSKKELKDAVAKFFAVADVSRDNLISFEEFHACMTDPRIKVAGVSDQFQQKFLKEFGIDTTASA